MNPLAHLHPSFVVSAGRIRRTVRQVISDLEEALASYWDFSEAKTAVEAARGDEEVLLNVRDW